MYMLFFSFDNVLRYCFFFFFFNILPMKKENEKPDTIEKGRLIKYFVYKTFFFLYFFFHVKRNKTWNIVFTTVINISPNHVCKYIPFMKGRGGAILFYLFVFKNGTFVRIDIIVPETPLGLFFFFLSLSFLHHGQPNRNQASQRRK